MPKIMFIPNSMNQLKKFLAIIDNFTEDYDYVMVNLDKVKKSFTLEYMNKNGIRFVQLADHSKKSVLAIIRAQKPDMVVLGNDTEVLSYLFAKESRAMRIPVLLLQDGTLSFSRKQLSLNAERFMDVLRVHGVGYLAKRLFSKITKRDNPHASEYGRYSDYILVWGNFSKNGLIERGIPEQKIIITGSPTADLLLSREVKRDAIIKKAGADGKKRTIFFATSDMVGARLWTRQEFEKTIGIVAKAADEMGVQLFVKIHPFHFGREPDYLKRFSAHRNIFPVNDIDSYDLLYACDAFISDVSSLLLESVALGKPTAVINITGRDFVSAPFPKIYVDEGVAMLIKETAGIKNNIEKLLSPNFSEKGSKKREKFIIEHLYRLDGKSSRRVFETMRDILKKDGKQSG